MADWGEGKGGKIGTGIAAPGRSNGTNITATAFAIASQGERELEDIKSRYPQAVDLTSADSTEFIDVGQIVIIPGVLNGIVERISLSADKSILRVAREATSFRDGKQVKISYFSK